MFYHWILYGDGTTPVDVNCHQRGCTTERVKRNGSHLVFCPLWNPASATKRARSLDLDSCILARPRAPSCHRD